MPQEAALHIDSHDQVLAPVNLSGWQLTKEYWNVTKPGIMMSNAMTTFTGLWLASAGHFNVVTDLLTIVGSGLVVMSGCALNNYMDRDIDPLMKRTQGRALVTGTLQPWTVMALGTVLGVIGISLLGMFVNTISALMALIGLFFYVIVYTGMTKRTTSFSTVVGSVSGAMPPLIGWTAITGSLDLSAWLLFFFMFLWQPPHFLALGMRRVKDYANARVPLLPVLYGFGITKRQIIGWTVALFPVSLLLYGVHLVGIFYLVAASVLGAIYIVKALKGLKATDDIAWANDMFKYSLIYLTAMSIAMVISPA